MSKEFKILRDGFIEGLINQLIGSMGKKGVSDVDDLNQYYERLERKDIEELASK